MFCEKCGGKLLQKGNKLVCAKCGAEFGTDYGDGVKNFDDSGEYIVPRGFSAKKNIIIILLSALLVLGVGATVTAIAVTHSPSYQVSHGLKLAERFLSEQNYQQAVIEFLNVLEIEPMNVDAYLGLADAYIAMDDTDAAIEILQKGLELTGDSRLQQKLNGISNAEHYDESETSSDFDDTSEPVGSLDSHPDSEQDETSIYFIDQNASYIIEIISDKEAHIEITSEIITDDFAIRYIPELHENANVLTCSLSIDNIEIGVYDWNSEYLLFTWDKIHPQIFALDGNSFKDIGYLYDYNILYDISHNVDTKHNKITFDVTMPDEFDFNFNDCENFALNVYCYKGA